MPTSPVNVFGPYTVRDRRGQQGGYIRPYGGRDDLYKASRQNDQRRFVYDLNQDIHRNISAYGRRTLVSLGKNLYANNSVIRGAINEMAYYSVGVWLPQFAGENQTWGDVAESVLYEHDKICDVAGSSMLDYLMGIIRMAHVEGDCATIYTQTASGYPKTQLIPGHRICSDGAEIVVKSGQFDGATIVDGVIVDDAGAAVGYRVVANDGPQDLTTNECKLHFIREYPGQLRGLSQLAAGLFDWQDIRESRDLELAAQKLVASLGIIEHNESGEADATKKLLTTPDTTFGTDSTKASSYSELIDGVSARYFRAGSQSRLEEFKSDRPSVNSQEFKKQVMREALQGIGWNIDFTLDPRDSGGASMRIVVEKINKTIRFIQDSLVRPASNRLAAHRIPLLINGGYLPKEKDWWKWDYQGPAKITADEKYSSDVAIQEMRAGIKSEQQACAERNEDWRDVIRKKVAYEKFLQAECKAAGVDPNRIVLLTPNGNPAQENKNAEALAQIEVSKQRADAYGVGVRAGTITPNADDESYFREQLGLPAPNPDVKGEATDHAANAGRRKGRAWATASTTL